ncbi:MAG: ABC transporter ATP-binding protein [Acidobacteria bacterium]|nr:ABC transporter ATP-binding protein [Acidobacteriota bacterium]
MTPRADGGPGPAPLSRALAFVVPYWRRLALVLAISLASTALSLYLPLLSRDLVDGALIERDASSLVRVVVVFVAATLGGFVLNVISGLRYTRVSADILFDMRLAMFRHLQRLSPRFYARTRLGDIMSRINNDIGEIQQVAAEATLAWVGNVLFLVGAVVALLWLDARLFLISMIAMPLSLGALVWYRRRLEGRIAELRDRSADIGSFLIESIQAMRLVVATNAHGREAARFQQRNDAFVDSLMAMQRMTYLAGGLPGLLLSGGMAAVFLYGGHRVIDGTMTAGTFVAFMAYQMRLLAPVQSLMGLYTSIASARVSLARVCEILDTAPEVVERPDAVPLDAARGAITFDAVSFSHDRGTRTIDRLSFRAAPGEVVAIVGPSGGGKSTVADLLVRFVDPDEGAIRIDGHDLRDVRIDDLRRHVVVVDQTPVILHASIADNLRYGRPDASADDLARVIRTVGLDEFVSRLPEGYDTVVGERGAALSAGERQRLAIARALLADPAVLVLDEPTAALDPATEHDVVTGYEAAMRGRTTILITHRPEPARRADRIVLVAGGPAAARAGEPDTSFASYFQVPDAV